MPVEQEEQQRFKKNKNVTLRGRAAAAGCFTSAGVVQQIKKKKSGA